ncbi:MAG: dephospho-CoA kinase, partial [Oscillospiraceae bacterium]|nr:dephospho-CoA kinase [Oscillospiraceae bacterium]
VLIEAGALFESGLDKKCDKIVLLTANEHLLVDRICKRDHIDKDNAVLRLKAQMDIDYVKARSNLVLFNDGDIQILDYYCDLLLRKIKEWEL